MAIKELQIGKNKITQNFVETLKTYFIKNKIVRISVLKSARSSKEDVKSLADELVKFLGQNFSSRTIGFKIILRKFRRPTFKNQ
jgi:RNA-binding protein YhbY